MVKASVLRSLFIGVFAEESTTEFLLVTYIFFLFVIVSSVSEDVEVVIISIEGVVMSPSYGELVSGVLDEYVLVLVDCTVELIVVGVSTYGI